MEKVTVRSFFNFLKRLTPEEMACLFLSRNELFPLDYYDFNFLNHLLLEYLKMLDLPEDASLSSVISSVRAMYYHNYIGILNYDEGV